MGAAPVPGSDPHATERREGEQHPQLGPCVRAHAISVSQPKRLWLESKNRYGSTDGHAAAPANETSADGAPISRATRRQAARGWHHVCLLEIAHDGFYSRRRRIQSRPIERSRALLTRVAHLFIAALLMSATLMAVDHSLAERDCVSSEAPAMTSTGGASPMEIATGDDIATAEDIPYQDLIRSVSQQHGVPADLVVSVIRLESNFNPHAVSPRGARGLMQLMPDTAAELGVHNIFDVEQNVDAGVRYLRTLLELFSGDVMLAVAAYNAGAEVVKRYGGIPPYPETQRYVERVLSVYWRPRERPASDTIRPSGIAADRSPLVAHGTARIGSAWDYFGCRLFSQAINRRYHAS
jgi:soluble lytic murein transglycosylase-like protein